MTDQFENDFEIDETVTSDATASAAVAETLAEEVQAASITAAEGVEVFRAELDAAEEEDEDPSDDDFFAEEEAPAIPEIDPATVVTIRTSAGSDKYVLAPAAMPLIDAIAKSGLRFNGDFTCWLNGQEVALGTQVAGGMTVTVVGSVKGG